MTATSRFRGTVRYFRPELESGLAEDLKAAGAFQDGDPCQPSAAAFSVTKHDGHAKTTDGPMHSASPWLTGYFVLNCKDRADVESWAAKNPAAWVGTVEVHPILKLT